MALLPLREGEDENSLAGYLAPLRQTLIDNNYRHVNVKSFARATIARSSAVSSICRRLRNSDLVVLFGRASFFPPGLAAVVECKATRTVVLGRM
jgi:hypothetical protein